MRCSDPTSRGCRRAADGMAVTAALAAAVCRGCARLVRRRAPALQIRWHDERPQRRAPRQPA